MKKLRSTLRLQTNYRKAKKKGRLLRVTSSPSSTSVANPPPNRPLGIKSGLSLVTASSARLSQVDRRAGELAISRKEEGGRNRARRNHTGCRSSRRTQAGVARWVAPQRRKEAVARWAAGRRRRKLEFAGRRPLQEGAGAKPAAAGTKRKAPEKKLIAKAKVPRCQGQGEAQDRQVPGRQEGTQGRSCLRCDLNLIGVGVLGVVFRVCTKEDSSSSQCRFWFWFW